MSLQEHFQYQIEYICGYCLLFGEDDSKPAMTELIMIEDGWTETINKNGKPTLTCPRCSVIPLEERLDG
mgnify:CR=1 FL=1